MEDTSVCTSRIAKSVAQNNITSSPNAICVTDAEKVINTKLDSTQVEGEKRDEQLLKGLLTDSYCYVCSSKLLFESHRLSHYEGKKHAQKVRIYLKALRDEKNSRCQQTMPNDKNRFCELCNMVFSSHVVAKSHYEGKVHAKNLRKQSLHPPDRDTEVHFSPSLTQGHDNPDQKPSPGGDMELRLDLVASPSSPSTEINLKDPNKYCTLCAASFNNPQMALQHYNGRKHQRNQARQELLKELGDDEQQAKSLMCQMCGVQLNSVEMYQAHMQGNKHQIREKKVSDLFKSQPKVYSTFADELADYIQVQKARGITPKTSQVLPEDGMQKKGEDDEKEKQEGLDKCDMIETNSVKFNLPQNSNLPHQSHPGMLHPSCPGPPWPLHGWDYSCPPPLHPCSGAPQFSSWPMKSERYRRLSSSSTYSTSSSTSYSSYSTHTSDSDNSEYRHREKRRIRRSRRDRGKKGGNEESDKEERRMKRQRRERDQESEDKRRQQSEEEEEERRRKKLKSHSVKRQKEKKSWQENFELDREERQMDSLQQNHMMECKKETELHLSAEIEQSESGHENPVKPKYRKEKKKTKEKVDTRTEEEKLWDDSILGC